MGKRKKAAAEPQAESYRHSDVTAPMRPDVGTQAQFRKKKPPATYRYDKLALSAGPRLGRPQPHARRG